MRGKKDFNIIGTKEDLEPWKGPAEDPSFSSFTEKSAFGFKVIPHVTIQSCIRE